MSGYYPSESISSSQSRSEAQPKKNSIQLYPGFLTKGLKGRLIWHSVSPFFNEKNNDWVAAKSLFSDVTNCINDPWPDTEGGKECCMRVEI